MVAVEVSDAAVSIVSVEPLSTEWRQSGRNITLCPLGGPLIYLATLVISQKQPPTRDVLPETKELVSK